MHKIKIKSNLNLKPYILFLLKLSKLLFDPVTESVKMPIINPHVSFRIGVYG